MAENKLCNHFIQFGKCKFGNECRFAHTPRICKFWYFDGICKHAENCKFKHVTGPPIKNHERRPKNTESFEPDHSLPELRVVVNQVTDLTARDVVIATGVFTPGTSEKLIKEVNFYRDCHPDDFKRWHENTHFIADDKLPWKRQCPEFNNIIQVAAKYFNMQIKATRLNIYDTGMDWKPFHHDAAAIKPDKALTQNFTVGISFGSTRSIAFQYGPVGEKTVNRPVVNIPMKDGMCYGFSKDTNCLWKHGIPQEPKNTGSRVSLIIWGYKHL